jgi:hypothetical protein
LGRPPSTLILGYYHGNRLLYAARTRNGFTPVVGDVPSAVEIQRRRK